MAGVISNKIYEELGVIPVIHAAGTKTTHGGTSLSESVLAAMHEASKSFVSIQELNQKVGEYIAQVTGAEAGMVTAGAASGVVLSMAACMTGVDINKVRKLPNSAGMKNELIMQTIHKGSYSHMYTFPGVNIIEIGDVNGCLIEELEGAINENTAAVNYLFGPRISRAGLSFPSVVNVCKKHNIPVIVDAAAMLPPKSNLRKYINDGADLVTFSGGKFIHGPQNAGLLFGRKDLVDAALANASPNHSIGRPHKVSKETIVGMYVALKEYISSNEEQIIQELWNKVNYLYDKIKTVPNILLNKVCDNINYMNPVLTIKFNEKWSGPLGSAWPKILLEKPPRVFMQYFKELDDLVINPINVTSNELDILADKIISELSTYAR